MKQLWKTMIPVFLQGTVTVLINVVWWIYGGHRWIQQLQFCVSKSPI